MADQNINIKLLIDAADAAKSVQETKKALRDLKTAALSVEEGSQAFTDISTAAGKLQDKVGDLAATTKFLGDDLKNLKGFTSIASGIAGSFAAAQGAAALFGGQNKQLEESLLKVQSAMGILQGIQAVGEVLQKESAATLFIQNGLRKTTIALAGEEAVAKAAVAVANGTATITQRALNAAMTANPIIALVALLVTATAALYAFSTSSKESEEQQKKEKIATEKATAAKKELADESKKHSEYIGKEAADYQILAGALQASIPGSQERVKLITEMNEKYGTHIQNLKDETKFQDQVTNSIGEYIKMLELQYSLQANKEFIEKNLAAQSKLQRQINELTNAYDTYGVKRREDLIAEKADLAEKLQWQVKYSNDLEKSIDKTGLKVSSSTKETSKKVVDTAQKTADKLADINDEYLKALAELSNETTDVMLENKKLLADADTEYNAIQLQNIEIEKKKLEVSKLQATKLAELHAIKVKAAAVDGTAATPAEIKTYTQQIIADKDYVKYVAQTNAQLAIVTTQGEKAILEIQKDFAEQRKKLFEETQKRVLAADEYNRFIDFLNKTKDLQNKLAEYNSKFGKQAADKLKLDEQIRENNKALIDGYELTIKTNEALVKSEEALLKTNQRNVEYQRKAGQEAIDKALQEYGAFDQIYLQVQQDAQKAVEDTEKANLESLAKIKKAGEDIAKAREFLKEDPQATKIGPNLPEPKITIPQSTAVEDLQKFYEKYKGQTEKLFDLGRESNLDQLGNNQKSIEILSALYGEKFNTVKKGEEEINAILAKGVSIDKGQTDTTFDFEFSFIPKPGQIGLKELLELENEDVKKVMKDLNDALGLTYQENLDNEKKYFEKSTFENYNAQQQKLADNKAALAAGTLVKRDGILTQEGEFRARELEINKEYNDKEKTLKENHEENQLAIGVVYGEKTQEDVVSFGEKRLAEKEAQAAQEKAIEDKKNAYLIAAGQSLFNTLRSFQDDMLANTIARIEGEQEARLAAIDAELLDFDNRDKQITAAEQAKIDERKAIEDKKALVKAEYDKKLKAEKIRQFNIQKAMDIIQIGINTAVAVSASLAPPLLAMVPFIVAAGAAEAFFVAAQQPNFAEGGLVTGPGGPKDDMIKANLSNGEVVINAKSSKKYARMLDAINQAGGGTPIPYRDGGAAPSPMPVADNTNMDDFKSLILDIVNRPIETYVKESSITNAQKSQSTQNRRTSF